MRHCNKKERERNRGSGGEKEERRKEWERRERERMIKWIDVFFSWTHAFLVFFNAPQI